LHAVKRGAVIGWLAYLIYWSLIILILGMHMVWDDEELLDWCGVVAGIYTVITSTCGNPASRFR
jgi:hypothetical protein